MVKRISIEDLCPMEDPRDGWFHIEAAGEHEAERDGQRFIQVLDAEAMRAICEAGCPEEGILVDTEHRSVPGCAPGRDTEAAGWVRELAIFDDGQGARCAVSSDADVAGPDGVMQTGGQHGDTRRVQLAGRIEWSDTGLAAVRGRRFKHFSTVYRLGTEKDGKHDPDLCEPLGNGRWRPRVLLGLALTNSPNNYGQRPICNQADDNLPRGREYKTKKQNNTMNELEEIKKALGLAPDAPLDEALKAIDAMKAAESAAAEAEAETLLNAEGLGNLPDEEKKELKDGLQTNRGLAMMTIRALKERKTAEGMARYATGKRNAKEGRLPGGKAEGADYARTVVNHAKEIQVRERAAGRKVTFWKAKAMAQQELGKQG